jgi:hypothetical protein
VELELEADGVGSEGAARRTAPDARGCVKPSCEPSGRKIDSNSKPQHPHQKIRRNCDFASIVAC